MFLNLQLVSPLSWCPHKKKKSICYRKSKRKKPFNFSRMHSILLNPKMKQKVILNKISWVTENSELFLIALFFINIFLKLQIVVQLRRIWSILSQLTFCSLWKAARQFGQGSLSERSYNSHNPTKRELVTWYHRAEDSKDQATINIGWSLKGKDAAVGSSLRRI